MDLHAHLAHLEEAGLLNFYAYKCRNPIFRPLQTLPFCAEKLHSSDNASTKASRIKKQPWTTHSLLFSCCIGGLLCPVMQQHQCPSNTLIVWVWAFGLPPELLWCKKLSLCLFHTLYAAVSSLIIPAEHWSLYFLGLPCLCHCKCSIKQQLHTPFMLQKTLSLRNVGGE